MRITVIICTYDRCQSLARALESIASQTFPEAIEWEVVVVDNNSRDRTREVVAMICNRYPGRFQYLFEPKQGKSYALNSGVRQSRGDILVFSDDDVIVSPTWLQCLTAALHSGDWAGAGGRTVPERTFSAPRWLPLEDPSSLAPLALFDQGANACALTVTPFGNNMAFRKEMFSKYGGFRTDLGPRPGSRNPQKSEDIEFGRRLLAAGERLRYEPSALVYHAVPESRMRKQYFLAWWFDKARADIRAFGAPPFTKWFIAGIPLVLFRRLAMSTLRWTIAIKPSWRFHCKIAVWANVGQIVECFRRPSGG